MHRANQWAAGVNVILALLSIVAMVFTAFWALDQRHQQTADADAQKILTALSIEAVRKENDADRLENETERLKIRGEIITTGIGRDNRIRDHYEALSDFKELNTAEKSRVRNLERNLDRQYEEQKQNEEYVHELEKLK